MTESEPALVTTDGLMEVSEEDAIDGLKDEDEKPKKRRRRRRKKKPFSNEEDANLNVENMEEQAASESNLTETFSSSKNVSNEKSDTLKKENQRRRSKNTDNLETNFTTSSEEILDLEDGKLKQQDGTDKENTEVEPKNLKEEKKQSPKRRTQKKPVENTDTKDKENSEENDLKHVTVIARSLEYVAWHQIFQSLQRSRFLLFVSGSLYIIRIAFIVFDQFISGIFGNGTSWFDRIYYQ